MRINFIDYLTGSLFHLSTARVYVHKRDGFIHPSSCFICIRPCDNSSPPGGYIFVGFEGKICQERDRFFSEPPEKPTDLYYWALTFIDNFNEEIKNA